MNMDKSSRPDRLMRKSNLLSNRPPHDLTSRYNPKIMSLSNRSGQVASTLTWFVATFVVFFIMIMFTAACVLLAGERKVSGGFANIDVQQTGNSLILREVLGSLLSKPVKVDGNTVEMRELIYNWNIEKEEKKKDNFAEIIKQEVEKSLQIYGENCYVLFLEPESSSDSRLVVSNKLNYDQVILDVEERARTEQVLEEAVKFIIYKNGKQINGGFYLGTC